MSENATVARPYAKAAFDLAQKSGNLAKWSEMLTLSAEITSDAGMQALLQHPKANTSDLTRLFEDVAKDKFDDSFRTYLKVLNENRRLLTLPDIAEQFEVQRRALESRVKVIVTTATDIAENQVERLSAALKNRYQKEIELELKIDPALVGGAIINAGDEVIDGSVNGRLQKLTNSLMSK